MEMKAQHQQNLRDADKAVHRGKFIALNAYIVKEQGPQINNYGSKT